MIARCTTGWLTAAALALGLAGPVLAHSESPAALASAVPPMIPTATFAARSPFSSIARLSPDGTKIAYSMREEGLNYIAVMDVDSGGTINQTPLGEEQELQWLSWAGDGRLLVSLSLPSELYDIKFRVTRLFVMQLEDGAFSYVGGRNMGIDGDDVIYTDPAGEFLLLSMQRDLFNEPEVWRFRLDGTDDKGERIERRDGVWSWIADDDGVVRLGLGYENSRLKVWYRRDADEPFRLIARLKDGDREELWNVVRLIKGSDEGLVLEPGQSGRLALRRFNYATRAVGDVVYENPEWDLDAFELDEEGKPLAVYFTDDRDRVVWLDPATARLQANLERALGTPDVRIEERTPDGSRMLVWRGGENHPGAWYVYTPAKRQLEEFAQLRPGLDPAALAPAMSIEYTARDGTRIRGYLTLPVGREPNGLPLIVMPHGGPYGVRDKLAYSDEVQLLANRGYAVLQPNYRGSAGFGEAFEDLGAGEIGRRMQDDLDDGMDWAVAQGIADADRVCLVGSSYGGYAALWGTIRNPERYRCAASFAGVTEWDKQLSYDKGFFSSKGRREWRDRIRGKDRSFDMDSVSPARQAARLTRPVLLVHGKKDATVPFSQFETMRGALRRAGVDGAEFLALEKSGHGFASPEDEQAWYDALVGFLARHNPADAPPPAAADQSSAASVTTSS
jgi:dipeptidyl aminopeptidase/acylaminoacyl peptidase